MSKHISVGWTGLSFGIELRKLVCVGSTLQLHRRVHLVADGAFVVGFGLVGSKRNLPPVSVFYFCRWDLFCFTAVVVKDASVSTGTNLLLH